MKFTGLFSLMFFSLVYTTLAQTFPSGFGRQVVARGVTKPTSMAFTPDGRILVTEQTGRVRVIQNDSLLNFPFIQLDVDVQGERGLLGVAVDPDFNTNKYIYLYYTVPGLPAHNRLSRFTANGNVAEEGSEFVIIEFEDLGQSAIHNGGALHFGIDGKIYVAVGDNAVSLNAQNLDVYSGKLLRINSDGTVPDGNPFTTGSEPRKRIWAYGLRNPFTFDIQPVTGRIFINDVGNTLWEEINDATLPGKNFGWPTVEGYGDGNFHANPIHAYSHGANNSYGCAITGGAFFNPVATSYPAEYLGKYFFHDWCNGRIDMLDFSVTPPQISFFGSTGAGASGGLVNMTVGPDGNLYYLYWPAREVGRILFNNSSAPIILNQPLNSRTVIGQLAVFSVNVIGESPFSYQWQKNGEDIEGATSSSYTIDNTTLTDIGSYRVVISNSKGSAISDAADLIVYHNNIPYAKIIKPQTGDTYQAGASVLFTGEGTDVEDGNLPDSNFTWEINFHHNTHKHGPELIEGVKSGSFNIPNVGETSDDVWYRIILVVADSIGFIGRDSVDIYPRKSTISLTTEPRGLQLTLDGQPVNTPISVQSVEGIVRIIGVITPQVVDDVIFYFQKWGNDNDSTQFIITPEDDIVYTALFSQITELENIHKGRRIAVNNPVKSDQAILTISSETPQDISVSLVDILARRTKLFFSSLNPGDNFIPLDVSDLGNGTYVLTVKFRNDSAITCKVIVVR